jgi:DNA polymerase
MTEDRAARLAAIAEQIKGCQMCSLYKQARNPVPGYGDVNTEILFIGEGPGEQEDIQGLPFVGRSGQYLDYLLKLIDLHRSQVFITNVVKHRPPGNRDPLPDEIEACRAYLDHQIEVIDPAVIVTLGRFSMARYFPNAKISGIHGKPKYADNRAYYPLYHPAAALRNPALRWDMEDDVKRIPEIIAEVKRRRAASGDAPPDVPEPPAPRDDDNDDEIPQQLSLF